MKIERRKTNRLGETITQSNDSILDKVESIDQQIIDILLKNDKPIRPLYKLFFETLALLHTELKDGSLLIPVASQYHANKYVYTVQSKDKEKYTNVKALVSLLEKIHDIAVNNINCDNNDSELEKLRSIKPPELLTNFHHDTTITINVSVSKSIRKLIFSSYKSVLGSLDDSLTNGKKILEDKAPSSVGVFVEHQMQAKQLVLNLQSIDPTSVLLPFFRNIFSSQSYRLRYIDENGSDSHHNICNGIILVDPPTTVQINDNKRKPRSNKKVNISFGNLSVTKQGYLIDAGLHFCLSDAERMLKSGKYDISVSGLNSILNNM